MNVCTVQLSHIYTLVYKESIVILRNVDIEFLLTILYYMLLAILIGETKYWIY